jgi:hypothetical protein
MAQCDGEVRIVERIVERTICAALAEVTREMFIFEKSDKVL